MRTVWMGSCLLGLAAIAWGADKGATGYQKGTIAIHSSAHAVHSSANKACELEGQQVAYRIGKCEDFHNGEAVEYRLQESTVYLRAEGGKEYKRSIEATYLNYDPAIQPPEITYRKGTIQGYGVRRDIINNGGNSNTLHIGSNFKKVKVYELHGDEAVYQIDFCGSFQAGTFSPGQEVEYRIVGERLYIRHDGDKEYSCQIEGKGLPENPKPAEGAKPVTGATNPPSSGLM